MLAFLLSAAISCGAPDSDACQAQAVFDQFIAGQNAHDSARVANALWHSDQLVWARNGGATIYGFDNVMRTFERVWTGPWRIEPLDDQTHYSQLGPGVVQIVTPAQQTFHDANGGAYMTKIRWAGVFTKTSGGWKLTSIFVTQFMGTRSA